MLLLRVAASPAASAAATRWLVQAAPSRPLAANAPGPPAFTVTLLRHRGGAAGNTWHLENAASVPRRYFALWFPFLSAERLTWAHGRPTGARDDAPLVLVQKLRGAQRLVAVDRHGAALGLAPGLALADARARIPDLAAAASDPLADADFLIWLAGLCERFTPLVALDPPDGLLLDITGCAHLFGGEPGLRARVRAGLGRLGLSVRNGAA
eukprot:gene64639-88434_t